MSNNAVEALFLLLACAFMIFFVATFRDCQEETDRKMLECVKTRPVAECRCILDENRCPERKK